MSTWLTAPVVVARLGDDLAGALDQTKLGAAADSAEEFVELKRPDLWVYTDAEPPVGTYTPGPSVVFGAALLAHRLYHRTSTPLGTRATDTEASGILRDDPDISRLLGIGRSRGMRFGAGPARTTETVI